MLRIALVVSLVALGASLPRLFTRKPVSDENPPPEAVASSPETVPERPAPHRVPRQMLSRRKAGLATPPAGSWAPPPMQVRRGPEPLASNIWESVASPQDGTQILAARLPALRVDFSGILAGFEPPVFYRIPAQYAGELREDFGRIAGATNDLNQFDAEHRAVVADLERDRESFRLQSRSVDAQGREQASAASKQVLDLQGLYLERKQEFEREAVQLRPRLQDPLEVFERKLPLYQAAAERFARDMKELEATIYSLQRQIHAKSEEQQGYAKNLNAAFEESAREAFGRMTVLSNRLRDKLVEVNFSIQEYNAKLGRYGTPARSAP